MEFDAALELIAANTVFTTHTPVPAGHDIFDFQLMRTYFSDTTSLGLFLDVGGEDRYWTETCGDGVTWLDPEDSPNWEDRNFSVGVDRAEGAVSFTPRPVKVPSGN